MGRADRSSEKRSFGMWSRAIQLSAKGSTEPLNHGVKESTMSFRQTTIKYIKDILRPKTIYEVIYAELHEAHLRKLEAETAAEYANATMQYNEERIKRLKARLTEHTKEGDYT
jgi:hypothetical protein